MMIQKAGSAQLKIGVVQPIVGVVCSRCVYYWINLCVLIIIILIFDRRVIRAVAAVLLYNRTSLESTVQSF